MRLLFKEDGNLNGWRDALKGVIWSGRMEEILLGVFVDGAHNYSAVERFVQSIPKNTKGNILLFSAVQEKNYDEMIECLCKNVDADCFVITHISNKRAADTEELAKIFRKYTNRPVIVKPQFEEAWEYVLSIKGERTVYCLGSLYLVGMIKELEYRGG